MHVIQQEPAGVTFCSAAIWCCDVRSNPNGRALTSLFIFAVALVIVDIEIDSARHEAGICGSLVQGLFGS
jgi:hypothetical protein